MTDRLTTEMWTSLQSQVDWTHSFIREFYFVSHRYFEKHHLGFAENFPGSPFATVRIVWAVVALHTDDLRGLEFNLIDAKCFEFQPVDDSPPRIVHDPTSPTKWRVNIPAIGFCCVSREILYTVLGNEYLGPCLRLGYEAPNDDHIAATVVDGHWRQCSNCSNAWEEFDSVPYARCPSCGELTLLQKS